MLDDDEKLRHYAQSAVSKHQALKDGLGKAKGISKHWERKVKEGIERIASAEKGREESNVEAQVTRLAAIAPGDTKAWVGKELARV